MLDTRDQTSTSPEAPTADVNPYVFVVGCQRSGTTLLQRMLDHHPQLAVGYDSHFIPRPIKRFPIGFDPPLTARLVERVRRFPRFSRLGIPETAVDEAATSARTYRAFVSNLYTAFGRLHGKPYAGEKSPGYCRHLPLLHGLFPHARTIHIIRDGRDVALSILDWGKGPTKLELFQREPAAACALWWLRDVTTGRRSGADLGPDRYHEIRYEDLVARPEDAMRELTAFLDLPYDDATVRFHEGKTRERAGRSTKAAWLPPTQGLRDWRTQMSERDLAIFEAIAGEQLAELGYEVGIAPITGEVRAAADDCAAWWAEHMPSWEQTTQSGADSPRPVVVEATEAEPAPAPTPSASASPNPYLFAVGCPRSGTTMLKRILDAHPQLAMTPETHWIPRFFRRRIGVTPDGRVTPALVNELLGYHKFANLKIAPADLADIVGAAPARSYADVVAGIFDAFARGKGKTLAGDKTPGYVQHVPILHMLWPRARFVHLIRDGRDVCLSLLDWDRAPRTVGRFGTWDDDPVSTGALWWERMVRLGREAGTAIGPDRYHEVSYEKLVHEPEDTCTALCAYLELPYDDVMVRFHEGRKRSGEGLSAKRSWREITPGIRDWRSQMSPDAAERFEAVAGDLLDELGYERAFPSPRAEFLEAAAAVRDRFTKDPHFKERSLPTAWVPSRSA
jgi:hypothetical protein